MTLKDFIKKLYQYAIQHKLTFVFVPWLIYAFYVILMASPQYESQSQIIVKSTDGGSSFDPSSILLSGVTGTSATNESLLIEAFIKSADMLNHLNEKLDLEAHFTSNDVDVFSRLSVDFKRESFQDYYLNHIDVTVDSTSSVITVKTIAFEQVFAQQINKEIVAEAERFINQINNDLARKKLTFAEGEHQIVEAKLSDAKTDILAFQSEYNVLDPTAEGAAFQQIAFSLEATLAQKNAELSTMTQVMSINAPEMINIKREIAALEHQINSQKAKINAQEGNVLSVSEQMARYSNLQVQLQLAVQAYSSSLITLENARVDTYQQLQHLVTLESPTLPDDNAYPTVLYNLVLFGVVLLLGLGIVQIVIATIREL